MQVNGHASRRLLRTLCWSTLCAAFFSSASVYADAHCETPVAGKERPRIGLALSGGGARGAAHLGVLAVLEENRIPIDYIAGTSMGSIVGGLYASGLSPADITTAVREIDWVEVFSDTTPRQERSFRRKRDDDLYLIKSRPGIGTEGLKLPAGIIQGQKINLALARLTQPSSHINDFDQFRIPFRAVATDIVTGEEVVLGSGSLTDAIRASMSVPAAFAPMTIGERRLVDGGVANNLPVSVVREMGADIVIAVDISTPLLTDEQVDSVLAVTVQLTGLLTRRNTEAQIASLCDHDLLIVPDLEGFNSADFLHALDAVPAGRTAAEGSVAQLQHLSLPEAQYAAYRDSLTQGTRKRDHIDFVRLHNNSRIKDSILASRIHDTRIGDDLSFDNIERDVSRIYGLEQFQNVNYNIVEEDGQTGLEITANERSWGPTYLQLGARYDSNTEGDNVFNLGFAVLATGLNESNGEVRGGVQLGSEPALFLDYHQPLGKNGMWFANVFGGYQDLLVTLFEDDDAFATYGIQEAFSEVSFGRELGTWGEVRAGLRYADGEATVRVGDRIDNPEVQFQRGESYVRLFADELDSFFFPSKGYLASVEWTASRESLGADIEFDQVSISGIYTHSIGPHRFSGLLDYGSTISGEAPVQSVFRLGGFFNLSGFNSNELSGQHFGRVGLSYFRQIEPIELLPVYAGVLVERGNVFENRSDIGWDNSLTAGAVFIGADTFIGPLSIAYGAAEGGNDSFYVFLGRAF
ncbi:MAG: patatin-like phospholipase family protein [Pseudomonadota bacterium]